MRHDVAVPTYRIAECASLLGVSDDTVRRWVEHGRLTTRREDGVAVIDGVELAHLAESLADEPESGRVSSARNHLDGIVVRVKKDRVMAQVELVCGPYRVVSLLSADSVDELGLAVGVRASARIKSTNVVVERTS